LEASSRNEMPAARRWSEEVASHQLVAKRDEDAIFHLLPVDREAVVAPLPVRR